MSFRTDVKKDGTVLLGPDICCDGFDFQRKIRVQTHIHEDHMSGFSSSKGYQDAIFMSEPTKDLLISDKDADIPYRYNIISCNYFDKILVRDYAVEMSPSNHMLGAVQTRVTCPDGYRVVYSSDFNLPLEHGAYECDELVIDSTACNPSYEDCETEKVTKILLEKIADIKEEKSIIIQGYRGRLQYVMELISNEFRKIPLIASDRPFRYANIYQKYGYAIRDLVPSNSTEAKDLFLKGNYIFFIEPWESYKTIEENSFKILLSRYGYEPEPYVEYNSKFARIALSDHSGFNETMKYIEDTNCERVITDSSRGGDGKELAYYIKTMLDIDAKPATLQFSKEWGV